MINLCITITAEGTPRTAEFMPLTVPSRKKQVQICDSVQYDALKPSLDIGVWQNVHLVLLFSFLLFMFKTPRLKVFCLHGDIRSENPDIHSYGFLLVVKAIVLRLMLQSCRALTLSISFELI